MAFFSPHQVEISEKNLLCQLLIYEWSLYYTLKVSMLPLRKHNSDATSQL